MSLLSSLADAVLAGIQAADLGSGLVVTRKYDPNLELARMTATYITVRPVGMVPTQETRRATVTWECEIDVVIRKRLETAGNLEIDPLTALAERIGLLFVGDILTVTGVDADGTSRTYRATGARPEVGPICDPDHLEKHRVFSALVKLTFIALP